MRSSLRLTGLIVGCLIAALSAAGPRTPAHYLTGSVPGSPAQASSGGEVFITATVDQNGMVTSAQAVRVTPPFTQPLLDAVRSWQFLPAEEENDLGRKERVATKVLVAALYRPPALFIGTTAGTPPTDITSAPADVPFPMSDPVPSYPPNALGDGVVVIEVRINQRGLVADAAVVRSSPAFDAPALAAARQWTFRAAQRLGQPVESVACLIFGFRQPIIVDQR